MSDSSYISNISLVQVIHKTDETKIENKRTVVGNFVENKKTEQSAILWRKIEWAKLKIAKVLIR